MTKTFHFILAGLSAVFLTVFGYFLYTGLDYYLLPLQERPWHQSYASLKPGGEWGHGFGVIGALFLLLLLLYSLKKRTRLFAKLGTVRQWMSVHMLFGVAGPLLICLHTTGKLNGIVAVAFWAMIVVTLSGFFGRYLYVRIPRAVDGRALSKEEAREEVGRIRRDLMQRYQLEENEIGAIENIILADTDRSGCIRRFRTFSSPAVGRRKKKTLIRSRFRLPPEHIDRIYAGIAREARLDRQLKVWNEIHRIFYYWHVFHKPFAIVMYCILAVHAGISIWLGYHWIF